MRNRGLTQEQLDLRDGRLTASRVGCLMTGDEAEITALWEEMVGIREPEDLSDNWPAQLGLASEELNLDWYEKRHFPIVWRGKVWHRENWAACTLDGWDAVNEHAVEAKHVGGFEASDVVLARYQPQLHWTMFVTGTKRIALSVIRGAAEPVVDIIDYDEAYGSLLIERAKKFMTYVDSFTRPIAPQPVAPPVLAVKTVDMSQETSANMWADQAATWLENEASVKKAEKAEKELKGMVPADAQEAHGFGIVIKRDRAGRLSLRRLKDG